MKYKAITAVAATCATVGALALAGTGTSTAANTFPSQDACHVTNNNTPVGNCGAFQQVYAENFNSQDVPVGSFSGCAGDGDFKCAGLKTSYGRYYNTLGAYPKGWYDTANPKNHSNGNSRTFGGEYRPDTTMSVIHSGTDGMMRVKMFRPTSGDNNVAAPVPLKCMNLRYGKFSERVIVRTATDGFKMAHLRYTPNEIDFPEAGGNFATDPIYEYTHGFAESSGYAAPQSAWTTAHTYSTEITPGKVQFFIDGRLFKTLKADFPDAADWVLQNESSLSGNYAAKGSSVTIDTTWISCYKYTG